MDSARDTGPLPVWLGDELGGETCENLFSTLLTFFCDDITMSVSAEGMIVDHLHCLCGHEGKIGGSSGLFAMLVAVVFIDFAD